MKDQRNLRTCFSILVVMTSAFLALLVVLSSNTHHTIQMLRKNTEIRAAKHEETYGTFLPGDESIGSTLQRPAPSANESAKHEDDHALSDVLGKVEQAQTDQENLPPDVVESTLIDIEKHVPSFEDLYDQFAIVSAFSDNHYREALPFIASAQKKMPEKKIIIYDLGIKATTLRSVKKLCNVEVRPFPWNSYPEHVRNLHNYAWKPIILDVTLREFGAIFWGDAAVRFKRSLNDLVPYATKHHGFMSHWHGFDPKKKNKIRHQYYFTNPLMYEKLGVDRRKYYESNDLAAYPAANRQLYVNSSVIQQAIMQPMLKCALELRCIAPEGSKVGQHRYDASLLSILIYKNLPGEWTPDNHDTRIFDKVIDIARTPKGATAKYCRK
ncbi:uncharacterized protein [Diadema antillarum]|uniref:uncharacterized protein n=1 Tax=Diadema antillarum TaxID=105358 RepID=UPI003A855FE6